MVEIYSCPQQFENSMNTLLLLFALILALSAIVAVPLVFLLELIGWSWTGVPYVPIPKEAFLKLNDALSLKHDSTVYDLGSGDGRVLYALAKNSKARFVGIEKAPFPYLASLVRGGIAGKKNVEIIYGDIHTTNLTEATHIYTYLLSDIMDKLLPKFEKELASGTRVVSCDFQFTKRAPSASIPIQGGARSHVLYIYDF